MRWRPLLLFAAGFCAGRPAGAQVAPAASHAIERPVPLNAVRVTAAHLRRRVVGNSSDSRCTFFWPDYNTPGNQVGQRLHLARPGWLEAVSFHVAACSYDSLFLRVQVYEIDQEFPAALLLRPVAVRLARADLANRVVLDLRPYHVWLSGDAVVALEILRAQGPGTLAFSAAMVPGPSYEIDLPGDSTNRNIPPRGASRGAVPWQQSPTTPWRKTSLFSIGINATILQESR
ncbi:hypothetical protein E4631_04000 [Hymenobacter sp. UV11]|uniref:hypothetical protein n=1 Tax=Hymenobacter sp. UV11 TaxID=1849735 RepID=UPI0010601A29|nr:hypothetical protein [Hymenobacter sp. UV11]TDN36021.1 hypothetical protein A8B98_11485 [Hymenobacter sp. UV11]TFZ68159.1 hypothetical protein E4631_04000 [Hymenobacter sp. UV11]